MSLNDTSSRVINTFSASFLKVSSGMLESVSDDTDEVVCLRVV